MIYYNNGEYNTPGIQDVSYLERQFREKLYELQNNTDALRVMQKELLETRHALYSTELQLEKERSVSYELKIQLKAAMDAMNQLEQQQTKHRAESVQLQVKYEVMSKQFDSLMNQTMNTKVREIEYKMKIQSLEESLHQKDVTNKILKQTLKDIECTNLHTINAIHHNIVKLTQEHQYLTKSCEAMISFNQRLQTVGLCTHAIHKKDTIKIHNLERMLALQPPVENVVSAVTLIRK